MKDYLTWYRKQVVKIMGHKKFCAFSPTIASGEVTFPNDVPTACTDGWNCMYGPAFIEPLNDAQFRGLILHENLHKALQHGFVWGKLWEENAQLTNFAADIVVNTSLTEMDGGEGFIEFPPGGVEADPFFSGWTVGDVYNHFKKKQNPPPKGKQGGSGKPGAGKGEPKDQQPGEQPGADEHSWEKAAELHAEKGEEIKRAVNQGESMRRARGAGGGNSEGAFGALLQPKLDPKELLRQFMTAACAGGGETTWARIDRRFLAGGYGLMPGSINETIEEIVIGMDTSGSCFGTDTMTKFISDIAHIVEEISPAKCHVIYWDWEVQGHHIFEGGQFAVASMQPRGGGGTNGAVLFEYLRAQKINPTCVVQFTDGEVGDWGRSDWPTLWAVMGRDRAPFGTTVKLEY